MAQKTIIITTTGSSTWTVPDDWSSTNTIRVIGGGGGGSRVTNNTTTAGGGGGGGAFGSISNVTLTPGTVLYVNVGTGGTGATASNTLGTDGGITWINITGANSQPTSTSQGVLANGGKAGTTTTGAGAGGATSAVATVSFAGGPGGAGATTARGAGGGGGSAGSDARTGGTGGGGRNASAGGGGGGGGTGGNGVLATNTTGGVGGINYSQTASTGGTGGTGGTTPTAGGNGANGAGGGGGGGSSTSSVTAGTGGNGGAGTEYTITAGGTAGAGGGGGGGGGASSTTATTGGAGQAGGLYGGGGGGGGAGVTSGNGGNGRQGAVIITYTQTTSRYWVGGTGTWDNSTTTNWAYLSGGTSGADVPTSAEDVFFDASSDTGAGFTVTVNAGATCKNLTVSGLDNTMTLSGSSALTVAGSMSIPSANFTQSYTGTISFIATTSQTITTNSKTFTAFTFNGSGGTWTLQDALTLSGAATLTTGTLALGTYTLTCDNFSSNNSNSRTINFGTGKIVITSASTATVWNTSTTVSMSTSGTTQVQLTGGGATTKTINAGTLSESIAISFQLSTTAGNVAFTNSNTVKNLTIDNNSFTLDNIAITPYGNLLISGTTPTLTAGSNTWTFAGTSTQTITTNGKTLEFPVTFSGLAGTWSLQDALTVGTAATAQTVSLLQGTIQLNSYTMTVNGLFNSNNTNTRGINFGTGKLVYFPCAFGGESSVSPGFDIGTVTTGWTTSGTAVLEVTGAIADANKYIRIPNLSEANSISLRFTASSGAFTNLQTGLSWMKDIYYAGGAAASIPQIGGNTIKLYGNFTYVSGVLGGGVANTMTFAGTTGTQTITTNGQVLNFPITFAGTGTYSLQDACAIGTSTAITVTLTSGKLELNSYTMTVFGLFSSSGTGSRRIQMSGTGGKIVLSVTTGITIWDNSTDTNFTTDGNISVQSTGSGDNIKTITVGFNATETNSINFQISNTAGTVNLSGRIKNFTIDNNAVTVGLAINGLIIYGNLLISGTTPTLTAGTNTLWFQGTASRTITTGGKTLDFPVSFGTGTGTSGTWTLQDALTIGTATSRAVTLLGGTLDLNSFTITIFGTFTSTSNTTRKVQTTGGGGKIVISLNTTATVWDTSANLTTFTTDGNIIVQLTGSGATTKTINTALSEANKPFHFQLSTTGGVTSVVTFTASNTVGNLTIDNNSFTLSNVAITIYGNLTINGTTPTLTAGSNAWTFAATSGTKTITTTGKTLDFPITFNGTGGTWSLSDNLAVGTSTSRTVTLTSGTLDINSKNFTIFGIFSSSNSNTRSIKNTGSTGKIILSLDTATTVWTTATITGLTTDGNVIVQLTGGGATVKTVSAGLLSEANSISFQISATAGTVDFTTSTVKNLTVDNNNFTLGSAINIDITIYGNLLISGTTPTLTSGTNVWTFAATSGTKTITTNGKTLENPITFNGAGGTWSLQDALSIGSTVSRAVTLTAGTLELNSYTFTLFGTFTASGTGTRKIQMSGTGGKIVLTTSGTVWSNATTTNMTTDGNVLVQLTDTTSFQKIIAAGALSETNAISFQITTGGLATSFNNSNTVKNLTIDNSAIFGNSTITIYGNLLIGSTAVLNSGTNVCTFAATSGTKTITTNAKTLDFPITFDGVGGNWQLQDTLTVGSTRLTTLTAGTVNINSLTLTTGTFAVTGSGVKVLAHGTNGNLVVSGSGATAFNATGSNLTSTGTGLINMTSSSSKTFVGGGNSYNTINQGGAGALTITGSNTFKDITNTVQPATVTFTAGTTSTFTSGFSLSGTAGNLITIGSDTTAAHTLTKTFSGTVSVSYCTISYSTVDATGWYALDTNNNINGGNNTGWIFSTATISGAEQFFFLF